MCGIAGYFGQFDPALLTRMADSLAHRGPDDWGVWGDENRGVGLAHRRLSIIDLSTAGHQPMLDGDGALALVFNGEIYNYQELRTELEKEGMVFRSSSDTEVLLKLYQSCGVEMLKRLNGIFAFALWDREQQHLFLARDGMGVKPLYYTFTPRGFIFASEIKALLQEPSVDRSINLRALHYTLTYLWCPAPLTALQSINKLEPGQALILRDGRVERNWFFYDLPYRSEVLSSRSQDEILEEMRFLLAQAVKRQMVADVEVGAFLSGGLDSSAVVAMATRAIEDGRRLKCFTICFDGDGLRQEGFAEDLPYAEEVSRYLDVDLYRICVGPEMVNDLNKMLYHLDEPQADLAPLHVLFISQLAREHGIKVLLSGAGGDDLFSGYARHYALLQEHWWDWLPLAARKNLQHLTDYIPKKSPLGRRLAKAFQYAHLEGDCRLISYFYWIDPAILDWLYTPEMRQKLGVADVGEPLHHSLERLPKGLPALNRLLYLEGKHFLPDHNLNYTDKLSMACGVEVRVPLLDPDLVQFAVNLPTQFKQRGRHGKWIFKKAMEPYLPHKVIYRPKTGFGVPLRRWLQKELRPVVEDVLSNKSLKRRGVFDPAGVQRLIEMDRKGRLDATYTIFALVCIELWCRIFIDGHGAKGV